MSRGTSKIMSTVRREKKNKRATSLISQHQVRVRTLQEYVHITMLRSLVRRHHRHCRPVVVGGLDALSQGQLVRAVLVAAVLGR